MADVTVTSFEEMEPIYDGLARRARASLGVTSFGMQVMTLPGNWDGYPNHRHDASVEDANQEEVYIPLEGSGTLVADDQRVALRPGMMVRVGARAAPADPARSRRGPVHRARWRPRVVRGLTLDRARRAAAGPGRVALDGRPPGHEPR